MASFSTIIVGPRNVPRGPGPRPGSSGGNLDHTRQILGQRFVARSAPFVVESWDDSYEPAILERTFSFGGEVASVSIQSRNDARLSLFVVGLDGVGTLRESFDQSRNWPSSGSGGPVNLFSGYEIGTHLVDEKMGITIFALFRDGSWYCRVGTWESDGDLAVSGENLMVGGADAVQGSLGKFDYRTYDFVYQTAAGASAMIQCKALSKTGTGDWT